MATIKDLKLDEVVDDLRAQAAKRIEELVSEGKSQARQAIGGHDNAALFSAFSIGLLVGALVGAAVALLITPMNGMDARRRLSERVDKMRGEGGADWERSENGVPSRAYETSYTPSSIQPS